MWRTRPRVDENEVPTQDVIGPRGAERACRRARSCSRRRKPGQPRAKHGVEVLVATRNRLNRAARVSERFYPQTLMTLCLKAQRRSPAAALALISGVAGVPFLG